MEKKWTKIILQLIKYISNIKMMNFVYTSKVLMLLDIMYKKKLKKKYYNKI